MTTSSLSFARYVHSSVIKKQILATTGLMLSGFLLMHLIGNCLIYVGAGTFNTYAHKLTTNPLIIPMEIALALLFLSHIVLAIRLQIENKLARPQPYYMKVHTGAGATFASSTMPYTGIIILVFLVTHLIHFKFGPHFDTMVDGVPMRDLYKTVILYFQSPISVIWYLFCMVALGLHLSHGVWSALQSFGIYHPKWNCTFKIFSKCFAVIIAIGFAALPIYCSMQGVNP